MRYSLDVKEIFKESVPVLTLCAAISIFSGLFLNRSEDMLKILPGVLIVIPSFIAINGNISSVLTSRLSSALHMGLVKPDFRRTKLLMRNIHAMLFVSFIAFPVIGFIGGIVNILLGASGVSLLAFTMVTTVAGLITVVMLVFVSMMFSYLTYGKGLDPDNVVIPVLTTTGDFIGILILLMTMAMLI